MELHKLALGGCSVSKCRVCFSSFYVVSDELIDGVGYVSVYELVAIVLLMQCSAVYVECLLLYPCCVVRNVVCKVW